MDETIKQLKAACGYKIGIDNIKLLRYAEQKTDDM